jgi:uncharacterized phiE125 gp8 family phage protein
MAQRIATYDALELVAPPSVLPISVADAKAHMRVDLSEDDVLIGGLVAAAVEATDGQGFLGKAMVTQVWRQWLGNSPSDVRLAIGPVQGITAVKYYDTAGALQADTLGNYETIGTAAARYVRPKAGFSWPTAMVRADAIAIEYESGYGDGAGDVPEPIRLALLMLVAHWYENRATAGEKRLEDLPFGFDDMLMLYRSTFYG